MGAEKNADQAKTSLEKHVSNFVESLTKYIFLESLHPCGVPKFYDQNAFPIKGKSFPHVTFGELKILSIFA
jgi:hypothetical protein